MYIYDNLTTIEEEKKKISQRVLIDYLGQISYCTDRKIEA